MKLIIGLGNPGKEYENSRHNVGYTIIDELKSQKSKVKNIIATKTNTFMNESGVSVKHLISQYPNIPISDLYIVHDDLDIPLGKFKIQFGHSPKDHNGVRSVDEALGTSDYWRVRVGIDNRPTDNRPMGVEYVLQNFTDDEIKILNKSIQEVCKKLVTLLKNTN